LALKSITHINHGECNIYGGEDHRRLSSAFSLMTRQLLRFGDLTSATPAQWPSQFLINAPELQTLDLEWRRLDDMLVLVTIIKAQKLRTLIISFSRNAFSTSAPLGRPDSGNITSLRKLSLRINFFFVTCGKGERGYHTDKLKPVMRSPHTLLHFKVDWWASGGSSDPGSIVILDREGYL
ncbi:hypothetical protein FIBSPDRAFT_991706, partial [Athelia psychrophila]